MVSQHRTAATVAALALSVLSAPATANDTVVAFAAGGLVAQQTNAVRMASEVLRISPSLVEVAYEFENVTKLDVTATVAFPMPDLDMALLYHAPTMLPNEGSPNFLNFRVWADEQEIVPAVEVRAFSRSGEEITGRLKELGIDPVRGEGHAADTLVRIGDSAPDFANWITKVTFYWPQTFPAGKRIRIRHTYQPALGGSLLAPGDVEWCMDAAFDAGMRKMADERKQRDPLSHGVWGNWVKYVLRTGANWAGPIGAFTLIIDKADSQMVSTCPIPGLTLVKRGQAFIASAKHYTPTADLNILFTAPPGR